MSTKTETTHTGGFLISEANGHQSRDNGTIISGQNLYPGAVLGKITASGKWTAYDPNAVDGSGTAKGILYDRVDASSADVVGVVIARNAEVNADELLYKAVSPSPVPATAATDLLTVGIIVR